MLKESVEASHPQGGSGEDLFLLPEDLASLISSLGGGGYREAALF